MRHHLLSTARLALLLAALLTPAGGEAGIITVQWSGPSRDAFVAAKADFQSGGDGLIPDTDAYQGCQSQTDDFTYCHGLWNQGLSAGSMGGLLPELDTIEGFLDVGFYMNVLQSMPFEIYSSCRPAAFEPCYTTFTPLQLDWDYDGAGGSPFVWLSSKGGELVVGPEWDGRFHGSAWQDIKWIEGVYGCQYFGDYWNDEPIRCHDTGDPFIAGMTIRIPDPVPEPATLAVVCAGLAGVFARGRRRR